MYPSIFKNININSKILKEKCPCSTLLFIYKATYYTYIIYNNVHAIRLSRQLY